MGEELTLYCTFFSGMAGAKLLEIGSIPRQKQHGTFADRAPSKYPYKIVTLPHSFSTFTHLYGYLEGQIQDDTSLVNAFQLHHSPPTEPSLAQSSTEPLLKFLLDV